ncbi:N-acetylglucosaminyl transferase component-domain-containing protein [Glomus cerebriforme]|uniref:N-acetylglucosaminyl transferase component-domain-containing protein n=1 Tax=Glomus cerebriforme TaxID=658196 RepID=A0A397TPN5_9GLOM|nr:N-acetylglucosaminyl transferase component-domain-containing protein [Glomus cerebriforme]
MNTPGAVSKIFWPAHVCTPRTKAGFLVGWNIRSFTTCIAAVISDVKLSDLETTLSALSTDTNSSFVYMGKVCGAPPIVLGVLTTLFDINEGGNILNAEGVIDKRKTANLWMTIQLQSNNMPFLRSIYCCGYRYSDVSSEIIFYKQPNPTRLQYISLEPLVLDIQQNGGHKVDQDSLTMKNIKKIINTRLHSGKQRTQINDMKLILNQINSSFETETAIITRCRHFTDRRNCHSISVSESMLRSAIFIKKGFFYPIKYLLPFIRPILVQPIIVFLMLVRIFAEMVLWILNLRFPSSMFNGMALKDLSATSQQIDLRLQQACFWPWQYMLLRRRDWTNTSTTRAQYISFYNSMWLVANDIIIGLTIGSFLVNNNEYVANIILRDYLDHYTIEKLVLMIDWLMGWPAGLKLNSELDSFLGELFLRLIEIWKDCVGFIGPLIPSIIGIIGLSGMFGGSMVLSLLSDFLSFMTIHIYLFYMVAAKIFNWQLTILYSLFNLFQGKKWNTLRNRIDSCDYDLDQLLLGTILFTLLTFLFPTVVVYYATFAASRVAVIFLQAVMETLLAFLNHFPLFAIMLRFKDPDRLPGGLKFVICDPDYFATYGIARVVRRIKSFWPWNSQLHKMSIPSAIISPTVNNKSGMNSTLKPGRNSQNEESDQVIRIRKNRIKVDVNNSNFTSPTINSPTSPISTTSASWPPRVSYLFMQNLPIPLSAIFFQYLLLWRRLSSHYFSFYVLRCLVSGETIRPIARLQYPMLPETRPNLMNFWLFLKVSFAVHDE